MTVHHSVDRTVDHTVDHTVAVTGHVVHVPSAPWAPGSPTDHPVHTPADARLLLGRKGLLAKEPATRLALLAVHEALDGDTDERPGGRTAVVVASMLNNVATVCDTVDETASRGPGGISAMTAPNASANVVASSVAIRYGYTGPNVLVANGATSGIDAVRLGARLLRAGRATRVVVVGVEPVDAVTRRLTPDLVEGAGCVVLEQGRSDRPVLGAFAHDPHLPGTHTRHEVSGHFHAASGVIQLAAACARPLAAHGVRVWCGSDDDGYASVALLPPVPTGPTGIRADDRERVAS